MFVVSLDASVKAQDEPIASPGANVVSAAEAENAALGAQLDQMRRSDDRLLQTVYWSLGVLVTVAALLVGFGWFSNMRLADNDRRQFRGEMDLALTTRMTEVEKRLEQRFGALEGQTIERVSTQLRASEQEYQERFNEIRNRLGGTQIGLLETVARSELSLRNANEVLHAAVAMIVIGIEGSNGTAIARGLDLLQSALNQGARPSVTLVAEINQALDGVPSWFSTDRDVVKNLLADVRTRMNMELEWEG